MSEDDPNFLGIFGREQNLVSLKAGEVLFRAGDPADRMYVLLSGEARIGDGNIIYEELAPGGIVGEMALIDHAPRSATVTAVSDCRFAAIDERRLLFLVERTPRFALNLMRLLSHRLRRMNALVKA